MNLYQIITTLQDPQLAEALENFVADKLSTFKKIASAHSLQFPEPGHCSMTECFWLYYLVEALQPAVVIESGTFHGYSLYFLRAAATGRVLGFEPTFELQIPIEYIDIYTHDWMDTPLDGIPWADTLVFFDDHVDTDQRVQECIERGVHRVVFHDNYLRLGQSHLSLRFANLHGLISFQYIFPSLRCDPIFVDTMHNAQAYRWLTYAEIVLPT